MSRISIRILTPTLLIALLVAFVPGCSDDDDDPTAPPNPVASVTISPGSATFESIGEKIQFVATALNGAGEEVEADFDWESSVGEIVVVSDDGLAVAAGGGSALIFATTSGVSDTASVLVDVPSSSVISWVAAGDGDWQDASNWSPATVPGNGDTAVIGLSGDYTVTLTDDVSVDRLVLGKSSFRAGAIAPAVAAGTQTLVTGDNTLTMTDGTLFSGAVLNIDGTIRIRGDVLWSGGSVVGTGNLEVTDTAELRLTGLSTLQLEARLVNEGTVAFVSATRLELRGGSIDNAFGGTIDFRDAGILNLITDATVSSDGAILKETGSGEASIFASSGSFVSRGRIDILAGSLLISSAESIGGIVDIAEGALLRLSGSSGVSTATISRGDGAWEFGGETRILGNPGQELTLRNVIFDAGTFQPVISGDSDFRIDVSLIWRRGFVEAGGGFATGAGSLTRFETRDPKQLSSRTWTVFGDIVGDGDLDLRLEEGALVRLESTGSWAQDNGGRVSQGPGNPLGIRMSGGEFLKTGPGAFVVETPFRCDGELILLDGVLTVRGDFLLSESAVLTGGGVADAFLNVRLTLVGATSAQLDGTVRPDLDGEPARMAINGRVTLGPSFRVELDLPLTGDIPAESLNFLTGGQVLAGTLTVEVGQLPNPGDAFRVISTVDGTGTFDLITGADPFTDIIEDDRGVLLSRS